MTSEVEATASRFDVHYDHIMAVLLECKYVRKGPGYFSTIARGLRVIEPTAFMDVLENAFEAHQLSWDDFDEVRLANIVLTGRRRTDGQDVYLLVEVAVNIEPSDVNRAIQRAALLEKLGRPVVPVVAGRAITDEAVALAHERGVWYATGGMAVPPHGA